MAGTKRLTLDVGSDFDKLLENLSEAKSTTKADIIRRAVATYAFFNNHTDVEAGQKASITDRDNLVLKDIIIP